MIKNHLQQLGRIANRESGSGIFLFFSLPALINIFSILDGCYAAPSPQTARTHCLSTNR